VGLSKNGKFLAKLNALEPKVLPLKFDLKVDPDQEWKRKEGDVIEVFSSTGVQEEKQPIVRAKGSYKQLTST